MKDSYTSEEIFAEDLLRRSFTSPDQTLFENPRLKQLFQEACAHHGDLDSTLTEDQKALFAKVTAAAEPYEVRAEAAMFTFAFRLGAWMMLRAMGDTTQE